MDLVNQSGSPQSEQTSGRRQLSLRSLYLGFAILSAVVSWGIFLQFLFSGDASINAFFQQSFATAISGIWTSDTLISALIFFIFARVELTRLSAPKGWWVIYVITAFSVGLCFSLSLFLYQRETWRGRLQVA